MSPGRGVTQGGQLPLSLEPEATWSLHSERRSQLCPKPVARGQRRSSGRGWQASERREGRHRGKEEAGGAGEGGTDGGGWTPTRAIRLPGSPHPGPRAALHGSALPACPWPNQAQLPLCPQLGQGVLGPHQPRVHLGRYQRSCLDQCLRAYTESCLVRGHVGPPCWVV